MEIITVQMGRPDYERYLGPILDSPEPEIRADAEIDMRREVQTDPYKRWWLAIEGDAVLAWCAAWSSHGTDYDIECGHNYERRGRGRKLGAWGHTAWIRQQWINAHGFTAVTYVFDQPVAELTELDWSLTGLDGVSEHGHHWQEMAYRPA